MVSTLLVRGHPHFPGVGVVPHDRREPSEVPSRGVCGGLGELAFRRRRRILCVCVCVCVYFCGGGVGVVVWM